MQDYIYSAMAFVAVAIHLIINFDLLAGRGLITAHGARYRDFLRGILAYYITDAAWGIFAGLGWTGAMFVDTSLYFITLAVAVLLWCHFVIACLGIGKWPARILSWFGYARLAFIVIALAVNPFNKCFFFFDAEGAYVGGSIRYLVFSLLVAFNALMALFVFLKVLGGRGPGQRRNIMVFCSASP